MDESNRENQSNALSQRPFAQTFFHGTKADLPLGDVIKAGLVSNFEQRKTALYSYLTATLDAAIWGPNLRWGPVASEFIWSNQRGRLRMIPI